MSGSVMATWPRAVMAAREQTLKRRRSSDVPEDRITPIARRRVGSSPGDSLSRRPGIVPIKVGSVVPGNVRALSNRPVPLQGACSDVTAVTSNSINPALAQQY